MSSEIEIRSLGYLGLRSTQAAEWKAFACQVLGMVEGSTSTQESLRFRLDQREWRLSVEPGDTDGLAFIGLEVAGPGEFAAAIEQLQAKGLAVTLADDALVAERRVSAVAQFEDPDGNALELFWGAKEDAAQFLTPFGNRFVTGALGLGHALLRVTDATAMAEFYQDVLGFRLTDFTTMGGGKSARFLHCNSRHHSIAFMDILPGTGLEHLMVEVETLDDVGYAYDRALSHKAEITNSIGRHANDWMVSFYLRGPGGIQVEYGWGGRHVDADWAAVEFQGSGDLWGHHGTMMDEIAAARVDAE